jgi:hypothetical protein
MKVLAQYIDPNGIKNKTIVKCPNPIGINKYEISIVNT